METPTVELCSTTPGVVAHAALKPRRRRGWVRGGKLRVNLWTTGFRGRPRDERILAEGAGGRRGGGRGGASPARALRPAGRDHAGRGAARPARPAEGRP